MNGNYIGTYPYPTLSDEPNFAQFRHFKNAYRLKIILGSDKRYRFRVCDKGLC